MTLFHLAWLSALMGSAQQAPEKAALNALYNQAVAAVRAGDLQGGCKQAWDLSRKYPGFYAAYNLLGLCATNHGDLKQAETYFRESIRLNPSFVDSRNNLAVHLLKSGHRDAAGREFSEVLRLDPLNVTALYNVGRIESAGENKQQAVTHLRLAAELAPRDPGIAIALVEALIDVGDLAAAGQSLRKTLALHPGIQKGLLELSRRACDGQDYRKARVLLSAFTPANDQEAEWSALAGYSDYKLGDLKRGYERLRRAVEIAPEVEEYWMKIGELMLFSQSNSAAAAFFEAGLRKLPESPRLHLGLAVALWAADTDSEAMLQHLRAALKLLPELEPALSLSCRIHQQKQEWRQLQEATERWIALNPDSHEAYYYQALSRLQTEAALEPARALLEKSIRLNPRYAPARIELGKLYLRLDQFSAAIREFTQATESKPVDQSAYYHLGVAYRKAGDIAKSREALARFEEGKRQEPQAWQFLVAEPQR